jgi:serine/threonine protein kinase
MAAKKTNPEEIFHKAIEISDHTERVAYLDKACRGDEKLRAEVEILLNSHEEAGDFLETPAIDPDVTLDESPLTEGPETVIGRYKLLEKIGEVGMASVYMAEQKQPIRRRVALKIIKLGMDTKQVIARFEAERQALAMMDHPNIAKVLDAGTTDTGRPYFVMELVRGVAITEFCDKNNLNTRERLGLFVSVCQAVQHAHQKGIIHRDIKPSNVMVTLHDGEPVPKVIDFGIAKAVNQQLTEKTVFTRYAQMIGTPEYMSPEQAEMSGLDVDIRTDVFSLGVLLYELLTGITPFDQKYLLSKGYAEMQRIIREEEPTRPSTKISTLGEALTEIAKHRRTSPDLLQKLIRTDLDWIVMKTLEKDRSRRYDSVSEFAADIKRHLNNEPVLAGRPSTLYRIRKFVRRNKNIVTGFAAILIILFTGVAVSTILAIGQARARAVAEAAQAEAEIARDEANEQAEILRTIMPVYDWDTMLGWYGGLGREVSLSDGLQRAAIAFEEEAKGPPLLKAKAYGYYGITFHLLGNDRVAEPFIKKALEIRKNQLGLEHEVTLTSMNNLSMSYIKQGRFDEAESLLTVSVETACRVLGGSHSVTKDSLTCLGRLLKELSLYAEDQFQENNYEMALSSLKRADELRQTVFRSQPKICDVARMAIALSKLGHYSDAYDTLNRLRELLVSSTNICELNEKYLYEVEKVFARDKSSTLQTWEQIASGRIEEAFNSLKQMQLESLRGDHKLRDDLKSATKALVRALYLRGKSRLKCTSAWMETMEDYQKACNLNPNFAQVWNELALFQASCPETECRNGVDAVRSATRACDLTNWSKPTFLETLAAAYAETGDYDSAIDWQKKAINMLPKDEYSIHHENMHSKLRLYQSYKPNRIVLDKPMVAWWKLDDFDGSIAADSSGNNLHGRLHGNPQWDDGRVGGALVFDDEDDYIDCGMSSLFDLTEAITVACWIKIPYFSHAHQTIIAKGRRSWRLQRFQYGERIEFGCTGVDVETNTWGDVIGKTRISDGLWHHVVGAYDGNRLCLYVDGKLDNFEFASGRIDLNDESVAISHNVGESSKRHWNGLIDDVRIYSYALTEDEIMSLCEGKETDITDQKELADLMVNDVTSSQIDVTTK